jgi:hypothetical protein
MWYLPEPYSEFELPDWWNGGRIYTSKDLHIGIRPHFEWRTGTGFTVQFTIKTPW